jgi:two-component system phosphate regulon sensor histidine kinase PhoR
VLTAAAVIGTLVLGKLRKNALRDTETDLYNLARLMASVEAANPTHLWSDQLARQLVEITKDTGLHLSLWFANGTQAGVEEEGGSELSNLFETPEYLSARGKDYGLARRPLSPKGGDYLLLVSPILFEVDVIGYVRIGSPLTKILEREVELRNRVFAGTSISVLIALGLGFFYTRYVTRPLTEIGESCRHLAAGNFEERIPIRVADEIGVVADTINRMAGEVRQRIRQESRERKRLAALLAVMADGVVAVSARGEIAYVNRVAAEWLGLPEGVAGKTWAEALVWPEVRAVYEETVSAGRRVCREARFTAASGKRVVRIDATPLTDEDGAPFGVLLVLHDLTEIRRLEETRRTFTANASHELKTPLTAIGSLVDTMIDDPVMPAETRSRFLGRIRHQNTRLYELVQDLLAISRLESDVEVPTRQRLDLAKVVEACVQDFGEIAKQKGVALTCEPSPVPLWISGNDEALSLIFNNLLKNALSYTMKGGRVAVQFTSAAEEITVVVSDTGVGIAEEHLERIFERFYRVDRARARTEGGTGLGLSIVKHMALVLDARVEVKSRLGEGSRFAVVFSRI